jgi:hypothetical protein
MLDMQKNHSPFENAFINSTEIKLFFTHPFFLDSQAYNQTTLRFSYSFANISGNYVTFTTYSVRYFYGDSIIFAL